MKTHYKRFLTLLIVTIVYAILSHLTEHICPLESFRPAVAILAAYAAIEGPLFGFFMGFLGNIGVDILTGDYWWNWSIGNGIIGAVIGLLYLVPGFAPKKGEIHLIHYVMFIILSVIGNYVGLIVAALVDVCLSDYDFQMAVFQWGFGSATANTVMIAMLGIPLLFLYTRVKRINS
ncbi:ECF transporter S component [Brevibacillus ginsengisoli]|uniref:ECF transporter S component n=1 Tax=Brevibacillus ginsengisoli TaxID=363854 RepID=UPI003CE76849